MIWISLGVELSPEPAILQHGRGGAGSEHRARQAEQELLLSLRR